jgi:hypothetical protein
MYYGSIVLYKDGMLVLRVGKRRKSETKGRATLVTARERRATASFGAHCWNSLSVERQPTRIGPVVRYRFIHEYPGLAEDLKHTLVKDMHNQTC